MPRRAAASKTRYCATCAPASAAERLTAAQQRMMAAVPQRDYKGRTAEQISPLSLPDY